MHGKNVIFLWIIKPWDICWPNLDFRDTRTELHKTHRMGTVLGEKLNRKD
jgi:hypothetical protein